MSKLIIIEDILNPNTYREVEVIGNVVDTLIRELPVFSVGTRLYEGVVSQSTDVTPRTDKDIEKLISIDVDVYAVVYPGATFAVNLFVALFVTIVSSAFVNRPRPSLIPRGRNTSASSPNNELSNRTNAARINGRIPDIFGTVTSIPDIIAPPYTVYENGTEVEYATMCIGRGEYDISVLSSGEYEVRDGETLISRINGASVEIYGPYTSPNSVASPQLTIGSPIQTSVGRVIRSNSVNGQVLRPPNEASFTGTVYFRYPNVVAQGGGFGGTVGTYTQFFVVGDVVTISGATRLSSASAVYTPPYDSTLLYWPHNSWVDPVYPEYYFTAGVPTIELWDAVVSGILDPYSIGTSFVVEDLTYAAGHSTTNFGGTFVLTGRRNVNLAGVYPEWWPYAHQLEFADADVVNTAWTSIPGGVNGGGYGGSRALRITFSGTSIGFDLDGTYTVAAVSDYQLVLSDALSVNSDWGNLSGYQQSPLVENVTIETVTSEKWVGPFVLDDDELNSVIITLVAQNGLYKDNGTTQTALRIEIRVEITAVDDNDDPIGVPQESVVSMTGSSTFKETVGATFTIIRPAGRCSVRLARITPHDEAFSGTVIDEIRWRDLYSGAPIGLSHFGNITIAHTKTYATASALAVKERQLNLEVTRKIPLLDTGSPTVADSFTSTLYASKNAADIMCAMARDRYIGNRRLDEIDVSNIYDVVESVETYFGTVQCTEFNHTFDSLDVSFEEMFQAVAKAVFCTAYRYGSKIQLVFERPTEDSTLLFNHRNKIPNSETREVSFGGSLSNDGVEFIYTSPEDGIAASYFVPAGKVLSNAKRIESTGVRSHLQAYFHAWREWNKILYANTTIQFDALQEAQTLTLNERILVADNTRSETQDGEVTGVSGLELTLSQEVNLTGHPSYVIFLQHVDGILESITISAGSASNKVVLGQAPRLPLVTNRDLGVPTAYIITGSGESPHTAFLVTGRSPAKKLVSTVTAVNYDSRYYQNDYCYGVSPACVTDSPSEYVPDTDTEYLVLPSAPVLSIVNNSGDLTLSWTEPVVGSWPIAYYLVTRLSGETVVVPVATSPSNTLHITTVVGDYTYYVRAVDVKGNSSAVSNLVSGTSVVAVAYVSGSEQRFSWLAENPYSVALTNSDVTPEQYPNAVLIVTLASLRSSSTTFGAPTSITVGGVTVPFVSITGTPGFGSGRQHLAVGMVRIPTGGFTDPTLNITWPQIGSSELEAFGSAQVFYNVDPSSDGFALDNLVADNESVLSTLLVPAGGAVFGASIQYTGGDITAEIAGQSPLVIYTMQAPDVDLGVGHYYMTGYRLFGPLIIGELFHSESIIAAGTEFRPGIVFVMAPG